MPTPQFSSADLAQLEHHRAMLRQRADCTFVEPNDFYGLLVARRRLLRANDQAAHVHGVLDPETGRRYLIERERLAS